MADAPQLWILLTNHSPYRRGARVVLAVETITAVEENAVLEYDGVNPDGVAPLTFVYTTGGSQFQVQETWDEVVSEIQKAALVAIPHRRAAMSTDTPESGT